MSAMEKHLANMKATEEAYDAARKGVVDLLTDLDKLGGSYLDRAAIKIEYMKKLEEHWAIQKEFYRLLRDEQRED